MITIRYADEKRARFLPGFVVLMYWILFILFSLYAGSLFGQTDIIQSTAQKMKVEWQDGGHAPGDLIQYDIKVQNGGDIRYEYAVQNTMKEFSRGVMPDSGTVFVQAWSILTEKSSAWSIGRKYKWLKDGQTPEPEPPDTIPDVPVSGWPVVYDAYNMSLIWTCDKNWYNGLDDNCLMIPSSLNPLFPQYAEVNIEFPTDSEYFIRVEGYDNGVKVQVDGVDLFTVKFAERGFTAGIGKKVLTNGFHRIRIYGWKDGAYNIGRVREVRFYREVDYSTPSNPIATKVSGIN